MAPTLVDLIEVQLNQRLSECQNFGITSAGVISKRNIVMNLICANILIPGGPNHCMTNFLIPKLMLWLHYIDSQHKIIGKCLKTRKKVRFVSPRL